MEDQIYRMIESKDLAKIHSILRKLVGNLPTSQFKMVEFQRFYGENLELWISQAENYFNF